MNPQRLLPLVLAAAALIPLSACGNGSDVANAGIPSAAKPASSAPSTATSPPGGTAEVPVVVLENDGLGFAVGGAKIIQTPFTETTADSITTALGKALGPMQVADVAGCPQGPRTSASGDGFTALLEGPKFVGWSDQGAPGRTLTTANGLGIGSSLTDLKSALGRVKVKTGSLGAEWSAGEYTGLLDGMSDASKVTVISAGETCLSS